MKVPPGKRMNRRSIVLTHGDCSCTPGASANNNTLFSLLLGWWFGSLELPRRIKSGLLLGPGVTFILVVFHLILALAFSWIDDHLLRQDRSNNNCCKN